MTAGSVRAVMWYTVLMQLLALVALLVFLGQPVQADTSSSNDVTDIKVYGNCYTATVVDLFTDRESYAVGCKEETFTDVTEIVIGTRSGSHFVSLSKGVQFHMGKVPVLIRVDKGDLIRRSAQWGANSTHAHIHDSSLAMSLLNDLARGQRVVIRVGDESGTIALNGSHQAIQDFKRRAGFIYQRSLEIPRQRDF